MYKSNNGNHYGFTQYARPHSFELVGKKLAFVSEDNTKYSFDFIDKTTVNYEHSGNDELSQYEAVKISADIFFISFGLKFRAMVYDSSTGLAAITCESPGEYVFCRAEGSANPLYARTEDMTGTAVRWVFGCDRYLLHEYLADGKCRCTWSPRTERTRLIPATYIHIKDGVYFVELNSTSPFNTDFPQDASRIVMLQDYDGMLFVGAANAPIRNDTVMVAGYGLAPETDNI